MKFIIFDLEWNTQFPGKEVVKKGKHKLPFEIIDIGAVKYSAEGEFLGEFSQRVKANAYYRINPFVGKITKLKSRDLRKGLKFPNAYQKFVEWINSDREVDEDVILCSWGNYDIRCLSENCSFYTACKKMNLPFLDVQYLYGKIVENKVIQRNLANVITTLQISFNGEWHQALNDARACGLIWQHLLQHGVTVDLLARYFIKFPDYTEKRHFTLVGNSWEEIYKRVEEHRYVCPICKTDLAVELSKNKGGNDLLLSGNCSQHGIIRIKAHLMASRKEDKRFYAKIFVSRTEPIFTDIYKAD